MATKVSMYYYPRTSERYSQKGFTIVELLIVIVIIGILAALVIVAYTNIQGRARDTQRQNDIRNLKQAIEQYKVDNSIYPAACSSDNAGCSASDLATTLVPTYIKAIPQDPQYPASGKIYYYVRGTVASDSYALYIPAFEARSACKTGANINTGWWGTSVATC